jgi:hypothetical protein
MITAHLKARLRHLSSTSPLDKNLSQVTMNPPLEPPILKPKIPLIGHLLGILWHQSAYLEKLGCVPLYFPSQEP